MVKNIENAVAAFFRAVGRFISWFADVALYIILWAVYIFFPAFLCGSLVWIVVNIFQGGGTAYFPFMQIFVMWYYIIAGFIRFMVFLFTGK